MNAFEEDFHDNTSDFDDRIEGEEPLYFEEKEESESYGSEDNFYRHLEEY
ncbi:hypothetical protein [Ekhidna sp.]